MKVVSLTFVSLVFFFSSFAQTVPSWVPSAGLIAWYPFTTNPLDSSGYGHNGVMYGAATYGVDRFGNSNSCYLGSGVSAVDVPNSGFPSGNNARSVSVWFKSVLPFPGGARELVAWGNNSALGGRFGVFTDDSMVGVEYINAHVAIPITHDSAWHHLTLTYPTTGMGSTSIMIYFDGILQTTHIVVPVTSFNTDTGSIHSIGSLFLPPTNSYNWIGSIDDIGVWDRELTSCEVWKLYLSATSSFNINPTPQTSSPGSTVHFIAHYSAPGATYHWQENNGTAFVSLSNGGIYSGVTTDTLTLTGVTAAMNTYQYRCLVDYGSCSDTSVQASLTVHTVGVPNINNEHSFRIFPNPAHDVINILSDAVINTVSIQNMLGQQLLISHPNIERASLDISGIAKGVYLIKINDSYIDKIVK